MCGICGILRSDWSAEKVDQILQPMNSSLAHRGPDEAGSFVKEGFGFASQRLSIVDVAGGRQPIFTPDGRFGIVMNGEIYNYRELRAEMDGIYAFSTNSDTEVALAVLVQHGLSAARRLKGMFAIALWDTHERKLHLIRDRFGIKPLYYHQAGDCVVFASEIRALMNSGLVPREIAPASVSDFLALGYIPGRATPWKHVFSVPPAHRMTLSATGSEPNGYWKIPLDQDKSDISREQAVEQVREMTRAAVQRQLTGDVPIGLLLSAGLDSNAVLHFMRQAYSGELHTFTARFADPSYDESDMAGRAAQSLDTIHHQVDCGPDDLEKCFGDMVGNLDLLLANPASLPVYMVSRLASKTLKVVLSGLGGDEIFFGYPTYQADVVSRLFRPLPLFVHRLLKGAADLLPVSHGKLSVDYKLKKFFGGAHLVPPKAHYWWRTIFTDADRSELLVPDFLSQEQDPYRHFEEYFVRGSEVDFLEEAAVCDMRTWLGCMALPMNDRCSMAHSLELRVPLLDEDLVEGIFRLPRKVRFKWKTKSLFREAMREMLPCEVTQLPKQGFHVPLASWFAGPLREFVRERLSSENLREVGFLREETVARLVNEHLDGRKDNNYRIWNLLVLVEWHRQFV